MRSWQRWSLAALGVVVVGAIATRAMQARQAPPAAMPAAVPALELASTDLVAARKVELTRMLDVTGSLKAVSSALVKARVAAEVRSIMVREGDAVKAGQVVATLDSTEFDWRLRQAEQTAAASRAQLDIARRAQANNQALVAQGFISATALENSAANEGAAQATLNAAEAAVAMARKTRADTVLAAPIGGLVSQRFVQPGERVGIEAKLLEIVDLTKIELEAAVAPEDVALLKPGARASLRVDGVADGVTATLARINPAVLTGSRSVMVYLAVAAHPALRQGLFARGQVELARKTALAVPASSIHLDQARPYVLVVEGDRIVQRPVTPGLRGEASGIEMVEVGDVFADGTRLLSGTVGAVRDGTPVRVTTLAARR